MTEWVTGELGKKKVTLVPFEAVRLLGLKTNLPWKATSTLTLPGELAGAEGAGAGAGEDEEGEEGGAVDEEDEPPP